IRPCAGDSGPERPGPAPAPWHIFHRDAETKLPPPRRSLRLRENVLRSAPALRWSDRYRLDCRRPSGFQVCFSCLRSASLVCGCLDWNSELEVAAVTGLRFHPDPAAMLFDNLLADREPDSVPRIFRACVQAPKNDEHVFCLLDWDADPVVRHGEDPFLPLRFRTHSNRGLIGTAKFDGVSN